MECDLFFLGVSACVCLHHHASGECGDSLDSVALLKMQREEIPCHFICALREM